MQFRFRIGQRVRLLKGKESGEIKQIYADGKVLVCIDELVDDVFLPQELVPENPEDAHWTPPGAEIDAQTPFPHPEGLYVALQIPEKTNVLYHHLVNHSPLTGVFFLLSRKGDLKWRQKVSGVFKPFHSQPLFRCAFEERDSDLYFQFLLYDPTLFRPLEPLQKNLKIKEKLLLKKTEPNPYLQGAECIFSRVVTLESLRERSGGFIPVAAENIDAGAIEMRGVNCELPEGVVDLHAEKLTERPDSLPKHEIFSLQVRTFERTLNQAIAHNMHKITFIHGIGAGKLRDEIHRMLLGYKQKSLVKHFYLDDYMDGGTFDGRGATTVVLY
jgi:hypothetical protein